MLRRASDFVLHLLGLESPGAEREPLSEAELRMLLSRSSEEGEIEHEEQQMIDKVFVFGDKDVADVMVAKPDVAAVSIDMPPEEALAVVLGRADRHEDDRRVAYTARSPGGRAPL